MASSSGDEVPTGDLFAVLDAADISVSARPAEMSNFQYVASYNWLDSSEPVILVPGMFCPHQNSRLTGNPIANIPYCKGSPAIWSPPAQCRKLQPDEGEVFIDQNAARHSSFPLEPMFRAMYELHPELDLENVDVVICRDTMAKLFDFVTVNSQKFEIDVQIIGENVVFCRKETEATEFITEFRGFGFTFPQEYTRWDSAVKGSSSHHRIVEYELSGLKYLLQFESDGYLEENAGGVKEPASWRQQDTSNPVDTEALLSSGDTLTIGENRPIVAQGLVVRKGGTEIDQGAVIDIETRAAHEGLDMESVLPRLWMSQTTKLIAAYHKSGRFDDVQVLDVRKDLERWEQRNSMNLRKLNAIMRRIINIVECTSSMKCCLKRNDSGKLEIWEHDIGHQRPLPDDLCLKLGQDENEQRQSEDYEDFEDRRDSEDDLDSESEKDFTACSAEDCGYCGRCGY